MADTNRKAEAPSSPSPSLFLPGSSRCCRPLPLSCQSLVDTLGASRDALSPSLGCHQAHAVASQLLESMKMAGAMPIHTLMTGWLGVPHRAALGRGAGPTC